MKSSINIKGLRLELGSKTIFENADISVSEGELVFIAGINGSGKSCLFNCIMGRLACSVDDFEVKGTIGYQEQKPIFLSDFTVEENIESFKVLFNSNFSDEAINELIEKVNLTHCLKQNVAKLSGGEKQRLSLAITLLRDRDIYLFDEAEAAMDPIGRKTYFDIISELKKKGKIVLWISHHIKESLSVADKGYFLDDGRIHEFNGREYEKIASNYTEDAFTKLCRERLVV